MAAASLDVNFKEELSAIEQCECCCAPMTPVGANFATVQVNYPTATAFSTYLQPDGTLLPNSSPGWGPGKTIVSWYTTGNVPLSLK